MTAFGWFIGDSMGFINGGGPAADVPDHYGQGTRDSACLLLSLHFALLLPYIYVYMLIPRIYDLHCVPAAIRNPPAARRCRLPWFVSVLLFIMIRNALQYRRKWAMITCLLVYFAC